MRLHARSKASRAWRRRVCRPTYDLAPASAREAETAAVFDYNATVACVQTMEQGAPLRAANHGFENMESMGAVYSCEQSNPGDWNYAKSWVWRLGGGRPRKPSRVAIPAATTVPRIGRNFPPCRPWEATLTMAHSALTDNLRPRRWSAKPTHGMIRFRRAGQPGSLCTERSGRECHAKARSLQEATGEQNLCVVGGGSEQRAEWSSAAESVLRACTCRRTRG